MCCVRFLFSVFSLVLWASSSERERYLAAAVVVVVGVSSAAEEEDTQTCFNFERGLSKVYKLSLLCLRLCEVRNREG